MKFDLYRRMAISNIRKNHRFFLPRILTEAGMLASFYILYTLACDGRLVNSWRNGVLSTILMLGVVMMVPLCSVMMFYTSAFLMKQRKYEYGLYNVLGLEKRHVAGILFCESIFCTACSILPGLLFGLLIYRLCSLALCSLLRVDLVLGLDFISPKTILITVGFFLILDLVIFLFNCLSIARMKPVELLASSRAGEREPRVRRSILALAFLFLGGGYFLAVTTRDPLAAIPVFFLAVMLVILGTYCLFVSGSIFILKALKRSRRFYYHPRHMTAVSGLLYRMKQNAVGLASITVMATCVLVMMSTTLCLYVGMNDNIRSMFPQHLYLESAYFTAEDEKKTVPVEDMERLIREVAEDEGLELAACRHQRFLDVALRVENGVLITDDVDRLLRLGMSGLTELSVMTETMWLQLGGEALGLAAGEAAVFPGSAGEKLRDTLTVGGREFAVVRKLESFPVPFSMKHLMSTCGVVVADEAALNAIADFQQEGLGIDAGSLVDRLAVSFADEEAACSAGSAIDARLEAGALALMEAQTDYVGSYAMKYDAIWLLRADYCGIYGSLLFLGLLLGTVFLFCTALVIYYKQISEGYEDRERFRIMEKIGMSREEVRAAIRSQVRMVFFLPLLVAGVHVCFAFPLLTRLLRLLLMSHISLFVICTAGAYLVFALVYAAIYTATARTYYRIVR